MQRLIFLFMMAIVTNQGYGESIPACTVDLAPSREDYDCRIAIDVIRPTQFAIGMRVIVNKQNELNALTVARRERYLKDHPLPLIIGPGGTFYAVDHHHLAAALLRMRARETYAKIIHNWADKTPTRFWKKMIDAEDAEDARYVWLFDKDGRGPKQTSDLPISIAALLEYDDPYRSLADDVEEAGGYDKDAADSVYFIEFKWANFFRSRIALGPTAFGEAMRLARSREARHMPGWTGQ